MSEGSAAASNWFIDIRTELLGAVTYVPRPTMRERVRTVAARAAILLGFAVMMVAVAIAFPPASVPLGVALNLCMMAGQVRLVPVMVLRFHEKGVSGRFRAEGWLGLVHARRIIPYSAMTAFELRGDTLIVESAHPSTHRRSRATSWVSPSQRERVAELVEAARREGLVG